MRKLTTALALAGLSLGCTRPAAKTGALVTKDAQIHYVVAGDGPAVVLIHGWALSLREWDDQIAALSPHYRVVAFDRRGYGRSSGSADVSADPGDIRALLDTLRIRSGAGGPFGRRRGRDSVRRGDAERVHALVLYGGGDPTASPFSEGTFVRHGQQLARRDGVDSVMRFVLSLPQFRPVPIGRPQSPRAWTP